jgi:hypothetical protein
MKLLFLRIIAAALLLCTATFTIAQTNPQPPDVREQYSATAFGTSGAASGKSVGVNIYVNSYTTDDEVKNYLNILKTQGQDGLEKAFDKTKERGRLSVTGSTGNDISFIRSRNAETKRIIRMASNRMMSFAELYNSPRSRDYKFTIVELRLDADGNGEGNIFYAVKLKFNKKGELEIEHYGQSPIRLANVRKQK